MDAKNDRKRGEGEASGFSEDRDNKKFKLLQCQDTKTDYQKIEIPPNIDGVNEGRRDIIPYLVGIRDKRTVCYPVLHEFPEDSELLQVYLRSTPFQGVPAIGGSTTSEPQTAATEVFIGEKNDVATVEENLMEVGNVPVDDKLEDGKVPVDDKLEDGKVPVDDKLEDGKVPVDDKLEEGKVTVVEKYDQERDAWPYPPWIFYIKVRFGCMTFFITCHPLTIIMEFQKKLAYVSQLSKDRQILLKGNIELDPNRRLMDYGFTCRGTEEIVMYIRF